MTDTEVIERMCERRGWTDFKVNGHNVSFRVAEGYEGTVSVNTKTGKTTIVRDGLNRQRLLDGIVGGDCRVQGDADQQMDEMLALNYEEASVILGAERTGRTWTEGVTEEGYSWIDVEEVNTQSETEGWMS
jgi:hypothetical protein